MSRSAISRLPEATRAEITAALRAGTPVPVLVEKYRFLTVPPTAPQLYRWKYATQVGRPTLAHIEQRDRDQLVGHITRVRDVADGARSIRDSAAAQGLYALSLKASAVELTALKDLRGDLGISVEDAGQVISDAHAVLSGAGAVVRAHPEFAALLADAVERRGAQTLAADIRHAAANLAASRKGNS